MATFYGSDSYCISDVGLIDFQVTNPTQLIGQRIARRLQTPRGALAGIGDDPNFGWDVRQYINAALTPVSIAQAQAQIQAECTKDEEVQSAEVTLAQNAGGGLTITIVLTTATGPFTLTLAVTALTVDAIFNSF